MRMNSFFCGAVVMALTMLAGSTARAQVAPFFNGSPTAFTPQISILTTGVVSDVQATVSADRKYVTLTMREANSSLIALRSFTFQGAGNVANQGFVGLPNTSPQSGAAGVAAEARPAWDAPRPVQSNILARPGMTRVSG